MKAYLFALLIGLTISYSCNKEYITEYEEGSYTKPFLFFKSKCTCIHGLVGRKSDGLEICRCYYPEEIKSCQADPKCSDDSFLGCVNK